MHFSPFLVSRDFHVPFFQFETKAFIVVVSLDAHMLVQPEANSGCCLATPDAEFGRAVARRRLHWPLVNNYPSFPAAPSPILSPAVAGLLRGKAPA